MGEDLHASVKMKYKKTPAKHLDKIIPSNRKVHTIISLASTVLTNLQEKERP